MRGTLCPALKSIFEHGLKKPSLLGGACHPWLFIEEVRCLSSLHGAVLPKGWAEGAAEQHVLTVPLPS